MNRFWNGRGIGCVRKKGRGSVSSKQSHSWKKSSRSEVLRPWLLKLPFGFLSPSLRGKAVQGRGDPESGPMIGTAEQGFPSRASPPPRQTGSGGRGEGGAEKAGGNLSIVSTLSVPRGRGARRGGRQPAPAPAANEKAPPPSPALHWDATREERRIPLLGSALPPVLVHPTRGWKEQNKGCKRTGSSKSRHSLIRNPLRLRSPLSLVQTACPSSLT